MALRRINLEFREMQAEQLENVWPFSSNTLPLSPIFILFHMGHVWWGDEKEKEVFVRWFFVFVFCLANVVVCYFTHSLTHIRTHTPSLNAHVFVVGYVGGGEGGGSRGWYFFVFFC